MTRLLYVGIGAAGTVCALFVLAAGCALAELLFGGKVDAALADTGDFDTHADQAIALTHPYPCGCGPMCEAHAAAVERTRRSLDAHRERIADLLAVWSPQDEEAVRKLLDGAA